MENLRQSTALFGDPQRCVHIGDRESDIYELFCTAQDVEMHFFVRTCVDRLAGNGDHPVAQEMDEVQQLKGLHRVQTADQNGNVIDMVLEIRYRRIKVLPPIGKQSRYPALYLTAIHARERAEPVDRRRIEWKLITDLPVASRRDAIETLDGYAMRWKIEIFHKIPKPGCKAEESRLRTADRLANLASVLLCIVSWRIFWSTMLNRSPPDADPEMALTHTEIDILNRLVKDSKRAHEALPLSRYLEKIAQLGGYLLARSNDAPPGNTVVWRSMRRLADMQPGFSLACDRIWVTESGFGTSLEDVIEGAQESLMTLHETTFNARILQSDTGLIHRKTLNYVHGAVTNAFNMSREVSACADTWRGRIV